MNKLKIIEFLKGFAMFTIVLFHCLQTIDLSYPFNRLIYFGGTGIHLFIFISGFGLYISYLRKPQLYFKFIKRRFLKIYIPYIIIILISAFISIFIPIYNNSFYSLTGHIFLFKMFDETIIGTYGYQLWFISLIFQFYFVFYAIIYLKKHSRNSVFVIIILLLSFLWAYFVMITGKESMRVWNSFFLIYLWEFGLGMLAAQLYFNDELKLKLRKIYTLILGGIFCLLYASISLFWKNTGQLFNDVPALFGYSLIGIWLYQINIRILHRFFILTGEISFSLFLVHFLIIRLFSVGFEFNPSYLLIIPILLVSYFSSYYYQKFVKQIYSILKV